MRNSSASACSSRLNRPRRRASACLKDGNTSRNWAAASTSPARRRSAPCSASPSPCTPALPAATTQRTTTMELEKPTLLVIEDDPGLQKQLRWCLDDYQVVLAGDLDSALAQLRRHEPAVVTMDLGLPPEPDGATEGLAVLQQILALAPL